MFFRSICQIRKRSEARFSNSLSGLEFGPRSLDQEILYLSGGNQQKAVLARCLAVGPRVLLLDEPTHGVDVRTKAELYQIVDELAGQGIGIVMVSSEIPEILAVASTIVVLAHGKQAGPPQRRTGGQSASGGCFSSAPS